MNKRMFAVLMLCASFGPLEACGSSSNLTNSSATDLGRKVKVAPGGGTSTPTPTTTSTATTTVAYDTSMGTGVDVDGFAMLPLRSGAHQYFVNAASGSDGNGCLNAQQPGTPLKTITAAMACVQNGSGDQVLLAEGSSFNEAIPFLTAKSGYSAAYPTVIQSYDPNDPTNTAKYGRGDQRNARPVLTAAQGQVSNNIAPPSYVAIRGIDFNPGNISNASLQFANFVSYVLVENSIFRYTGLSFDTGEAQSVFPTTQKIIVRNNSFYGQWNSVNGRAGGLYVAGYVGTTVEDNVFYHCGWKVGASRDDSYSTGGATVFSHSYYIQTNTTGTILRRNLSADAAGDGGTLRGDSTVTENLYLDNPFAIDLGGGPNYNTDRPNGVTFDASYNAILGDADVNSSHPLGWGINTANGQSGSRVHNNLMVRTRDPSGPAVSGFSNYASFNQPSYAQYDHNLMYQWVAPTGQVYYAGGGNFPAQSHVTYDYNNWDGSVQGTNTNSASTVFPNAYTAATLYAALGFADKSTFINYAINHPEAHIQRTARALLFSGYAM